MIILIAIFLLLLIPAVMLAVRLLRNRASYLWSLGFFGALVVWPLVLFSRLNMPQVVAFLSWQPQVFFPFSPELLLDTTSWVFAFALATQVLSVMMTSVARLSGPNLVAPEIQSGSINPEDQPPSPTFIALQAPLYQSNNWRAWAGNLALTSFGLVAVLAGNLLTLVLAWAALDIVELVILLGQVTTGQQRERVVVAFSARVGGIAVMFMAGIVIWQQAGGLDFSSITPQSSLVLMLAAGLRLGILPLHLPFTHELPMRRGIGTILRQVPVAASLVLLVRTAEIPVPTGVVPYLICFTALAGGFGAIGWLRAADELAGRPYWILTTASLAMAAALHNQPQACLVWSLAALLPGTLLFTTSLRRRILAPIILLSLLGLTGLPITPTWAGTSIFQPLGATAGVIAQIFSWLTGFFFIGVHAMLLAGYLVHGLRGIMYSDGEPVTQVERWIWLLYFPGLLLLPVIHWLLGWHIRSTMGYPWSLPETSLLTWVEGPLALGLAAAIWYYRPRLVKEVIAVSMTQSARQWLPVSLFYRFIWGIYRIIAQIIKVISITLEGEAGILWALVLMVLILVSLQR